MVLQQTLPLAGTFDAHVKHNVLFRGLVFVYEVYRLMCVDMELVPQTRLDYHHRVLLEEDRVKKNTHTHVMIGRRTGVAATVRPTNSSLALSRTTTRRPARRLGSAATHAKEDYSCEKCVRGATIWKKFTDCNCPEGALFYDAPGHQPNEHQYYCEMPAICTNSSATTCLDPP